MGKKLQTEDELTEAIHHQTKSVYELQMLRLDEYAKAKKWDASGMEVLYLLLAEKYHWTPAQVRSLTNDELALFIDFLTSGAKK